MVMTGGIAPKGSDDEELKQKAIDLLDTFIVLVEQRALWFGRKDNK